MFPVSLEDTNSSLSPSAVFAAWASRCFSSSSVRVARSPRFGGRCIGMLAVAGHCPCRSGSPQAVLGAVYALTLDFAAGFAVCAAKGTAIKTSATHPVTSRVILLLLVVLGQIRV